MRVLEIRDDLINIRELIEVCISALLLDDRVRVKTANVLFFQVLHRLDILDKNLTEVKEFRNVSKSV